MTSTTHDLDRLLAESIGEGETVTLFDREWTLPADVDAETMLRVQRIQMRVALAKKQGRELKEDEIVDDAVTLEDVIESMAGAENFAEWRKLGLGYKGMQVIAGKLYAIHNKDQSPSGKGQKPGQVKPKRKTTATARSQTSTTAQD